MTGYLRLIRRERTGQVHIAAGATVRMSGRLLTASACDQIIAGPVYDGMGHEVTCQECIAAAREKS